MYYVKYMYCMLFMWQVYLSGKKKPRYTMVPILQETALRMAEDTTD